MRQALLVVVSLLSLCCAVYAIIVSPMTTGWWRWIFPAMFFWFSFDGLRQAWRLRRRDPK